MTCGVVEEAQEAGELAVVDERGRRVLGRHLDGERADALDALRRAIDDSLKS